MLQVLEPFEIADCDTASATKNIRQKFHSFFSENSLSSFSCRPVSCLYDQLAVKFVSIVNIDCFFEGRWDEDIAIFIYCLLIVENFCLRAYKTMNTVLTFFIPPEWLRINSIGGVIDTTVLFSHTDDNSSSLCEEFGSPISHISETLNYNSFSFNSWLQVELWTQILILKDFPSRIEDSQPSWLSSSSNSMLLNMLSSCHSCCIDITMSIKILVSVFD